MNNTQRTTRLQKQREYMAKPGMREKYRAYYVARYAAKRDEIKRERKAYGLQYRKTKPWQKLLCCARTRAKKQGVEYALSFDWAVAEYDGKCAITGIPFVIESSTRRGPRPYSPSIDRIDPSLGYVPNNCRFVLMAVNAFRGTLTDEEMLVIAKAIIGGSVHDRDTNAAINIARRGCATLAEGIVQ